MKFLKSFLFFIFINSLFSIQAYTVSQNSSNYSNFIRDDNFYAKVIDSSGNILKSGNLILSLEDSPLKRKVYKISDTGFIICPKNDFNDKVIWSFQHQNYANQCGVGLELKKYSKITPFKIRVNKGQPLKLKMVNSEGKPISGVQVKLGYDVDRENESLFYEDLDFATSDVSGNVFLPHVLKGKVKVSASSNLWITKEPIQVLHPTKQEISIKLYSALEFNLEVFDQQKTAIHDIKIKWFCSDNKIKNINQKEIKVKGNMYSGNINPILLQIPKSRYVHLKLASDSMMEKEIINIDLTKKRSFEIVAKRKPMLFGIVTDNDGNPIKDAEIKIEYKYSEYQYAMARAGRMKIRRNNVTIRSDQHGKYKNYIAEKGTVNITVISKDYLQKDYKDFDLNKTKNKELNIKLEKGQKGLFRFITYVDNEEVILANQKVKYQISNISYNKKYNSSRINAKKYIVTTDNEGYYNLKGWKENDDVIFDIKGFFPKTIKLKPFKETKLINFSPIGGVAIYVKDEKGDDIPNAKFDVKDLDIIKFADSVVRRKFSTVKYDDKKKYYAVSGLLPGRYKFDVRAKGYSDSEVQFLSVEKKSIQKVEVILNSTMKKELRFKVETDDQVPLNSIKVIPKNLTSRIYYNNYDLKKEEDEEYFKLTLDLQKFGHVSVEARGYKPSGDIPLIDDKDNTHIYYVTLDSGLSLLGKVVNMKKDMHRRTTIMLISKTNIWSTRNRIASLSADGTFEFKGLEEGEFELIVSNYNYSTYRKTITISPNMPELLIELTKGSLISGKVVNEHKTPLEGINVHILKNGENGFEIYRDGNGSYKKRSSNQGRFGFGGLKKGEYRVDINSKEGFGKSRVINIGEKRSNKTIEIIFNEGLELSGRVVDLEGKYVPDIHLNLNKNYGMENKYDRTNTEGEFKFIGLSEGDYYVNLNDDLYEIVSESDSNHAKYRAGHKDVLIKVKKSDTLNCLIMTPDEKKNIKSQVYIRDTINNYLYKIKDLDEVNFSLSKKPLLKKYDYIPNFQIIVKSNGYNQGVSQELNANSFKHKKEIVIKLKPEKLLNLLIRNKENEPLSQVKVRYRKSNNTDYSINGRGDFFFSNQKGHVSIPGIDSGVYHLHLDRYGYATKDILIEVDENSSETHQILLGKGGVIHGMYRDINGRGLNNIKLGLKRYNSKSNFYHYHATTDENGFFKIKNVSEGLYRIHNKEHQLRNNEFQSKNDTIIEVKDGAVVEVNLGQRNEANKGILRGKLKNLSDFSNARLMDLKTDEIIHQIQIRNNRFEMRSVNPGNYVIKIIARHGTSINKNIEISAGEVTDVTFENSNMSISAIVHYPTREEASQFYVSLIQTATLENDLLHVPQAIEISSTKSQNEKLFLNIDQSGEYILYIISSSSGLNNKKGSKIIKFNIQEGEELDLGDIFMDECIEVGGLIIDENNVPITGVQLSLKNQYGIPLKYDKYRYERVSKYKTYYVSLYKSNHFGQVLLDFIPELPVIVTAERKGYISKSITLNKQNFTLQLEKESQIKVELSGEKVVNRLVELIVLNQTNEIGNIHKSKYKYLKNTNQFGKVEFSGLKEGDYKIKVKLLMDGDDEILSDIIPISKEEVKQVNVELSDEY